MPTKLSQYCEGIMEAAWLAAAIVVPVFFNVFSARIFEPDKLTLLRTLALVILAAWLIKLIEEGKIRWERLQPDDSPLKVILRIPFLIPVSMLVIVYLISTIFSVSPRSSLLGSYQRLQGTYTTFSYLVVFLAIIGNLRRRVQIERLITTIILASLPVSLYGVLQHYQIDPIPWGGNVSARVAANLGNSIFIAAYLIMVFPLTALRIVESFGAILNDRGRLGANFTRSTIYVFIGALELIAMFFSGSRGPWLGWAASLIFILLILALIWRLRWLVISGVSLAMLGAVGLLILNIPGGPFESFRAIPGIGRLGQLLDAESRTGRVRTLIWQGAAELVAPHQPIAYPDGSKDTFNFIRPLIGYGPESMYVAYNPFYQPGLTQVEKRNASPDRSHNETWDSLVITGILGLVVYLTLFGSIFYFGLNWLGLITSIFQRNLFLGLLSGGGVLSATVFVAWKGWAYFGVGLPFGIMIGLVLYLIFAALFGHYESPQSDGDKIRALTMMGLLAAIVAHFVEINFGIAIAATRTYFWVYAGLLLIVGYILPLSGEYRKAGYADGSIRPETISGPASSGSRPPDATKPVKGTRKDKLSTSTSSKKKRYSGKPAMRRMGTSGSSQTTLPNWLREAMIGALVIVILLATLGFNFITNSQGGLSAGSIVWSSFTRLKSAATGTSFGILAMILTSWLVGSILLASESALAQEGLAWGKILGGILGASLFLSLLYWLWHGSGLASLVSFQAKSIDDVLFQTRRYEGLLTNFYTYLLLAVFILGLYLLLEKPLPVKGGKDRPGTGRTSNPVRLGLVLGPVALLVVIWLASYTNLRVIQADIAFKLAEPFARGTSWPVAIKIYQHANELAPSEDYYYLFLGRAYLEYGKTLSDANEREQLIQKAANDLRRAQTISPLNTDHTANLARLYSLWTGYTSDAKLRAEKAQISSDYFAKALTLSPKNTRIWDEWGLLFLNTLNEPAEAYQRLQYSLEIDPYYDWTYGLLGDYYTRTVRNLKEDQVTEREQALRQAADSYRKALDLSNPSDVQMRYSYILALGGVETQLDELDNAITAYQQAIQWIPNSPDKWWIEEKIARIYAQIGDSGNALTHAQSALSLAPDDQKARIQTLIDQISGKP